MCVYRDTERRLFGSNKKVSIEKTFDIDKSALKNKYDLFATAAPIVPFLINSVQFTVALVSADHRFQRVRVSVTATLERW